MYPKVKNKTSERYVKHHCIGNSNSNNKTHLDHEHDEIAETEERIEFYNPQKTSRVNVNCDQSHVIFYTVYKYLSMPKPIPYIITEHR